MKGVIIFFFFFYDLYSLNENFLIKEAFRQICANKLLSDMYYDMEEYINGKFKKIEIHQELSLIRSPFEKLYENPYPSEENAYSKWNDFIRNYLHNDPALLNNNSEFKLDLVEAKAIVNWIYRAYSNSEQRREKTKEYLNKISESFELEELSFVDTIIYVKSKVNINIITSFEKFSKAMNDIDSSKQTFYYRGHSDSNYLLLPSLMRNREWLEHEHDMYNELIIECSRDFSHCVTHLDFLVHMQHYGLPTRLVDITRNPLVALYFACENNNGKKGEVIVFNVVREKIKYPGSDTATVLASLPLFRKEIKDKFSALASDPIINQVVFNQELERLLHEIKLEKPAFKDEIHKTDILDCFFVLSEKRNNRIIKQDGAFIICGLFDEINNPINKYRYKNQNKIQVFIIESKSKKSIMRMLNKFSINKAGLFPEITDVTEYIKSKYSE
ncbi:MAG: FRG domain-containing protein [Youngiibacter sp.]|nr:FRG domain-containing protein [Youngiibacter sp.]